MIVLGRKVKDCITRFEGIATARCEYLDSTPTVRVESINVGPDGRMVAEWIAEERLHEVVAEDIA